MTTVTVTEETIELTQDVVETITVTVAEQGPPGVGIADAFLISNRFNELTTAQMKIEARTNLELNNIDCGEFL